jgi:hypothetical protein
VISIGDWNKPGGDGLAGFRGGKLVSNTDIDAECQRERLDIAHRLYQALIAQDPDRAITLCDGEGRVVARHYRDVLKYFLLRNAASPDLRKRSHSTAATFGRLLRTVAVPIRQQRLPNLSCRRNVISINPKA